MSHDPLEAPAHCAEAAASWMAPERPVSTPPPESVLARIERAGPAALDDRELLALLGIGVDGPTLAASGGLRGLLDDPGDRLRAVVLPRADRARVHALHEVHARWMEARLTGGGAPFTSPAHTRRYIEARLRGYRNEVFACLFLTNRHQVIAWEEIFFGTLDGTSVHPRVVVRRALVHNAGAIVCAHNHPSGCAEVSLADRAITQRLAEALALVDVRLIDHFVVGDGECASFAEMGLL